MMNEWIEKNKYLVVSSGVLLVIVVGVFLALSLKEKKSGDGVVEDSQSQSQTNTEDGEGVVASSNNSSETQNGVSKTTYPALSNVSLTIPASSKSILESRKKEIEKTIAAFTDETKIDVKIGNYVALAADERALGNYKTAEELLLKAIALDPKNPYPYQAYSALLWVAGQKEHAISEINTAIKLKGNEFNFWLSKIMYSDSLQPAAVEQIYQNALTSTGNDINIVTSFAVFEENTGDIQGAIALWKKAQTIAPERKEMYQVEIDRLLKK